MSRLVAVLFLVIGIGLFFISIVIRSKTGGKYEIKTIDIVLFIMPLFLWLVATGKIQRVVIGDLEFETAQAFINASQKPIEEHITRTPPASIEKVVQVMESETKGGIERIPKLIENKTEALEFVLGLGGYWGPAIQEYFESLYASSYLRYAIVYKKNGELFGLYDAQKLMDHFRRIGYQAYDNFAAYLNKDDADALSNLSAIPGFIPGSYKVEIQAEKRSVLDKMQKLNQKILPAVDSNGKFVGIVDRDRLVSDLIIDVIDKLGAKSD